MVMRYIVLLILLFINNNINAWDYYWKISNDGIVWNVRENNPHMDHIEMSGKYVSVVLRYGIDLNKKWVINKSLIWPMLRTIPNNTYASLMRRYNWNILDYITINGCNLDNENIDYIRFNGLLVVKSHVQQNGNQYEIVREYFPSIDKPALVELYKIINKGCKEINIEVPSEEFIVKTDPQKGVNGSYYIRGKVQGSGSFILAPNDSISFSASILAHDNYNDPIFIDGIKEKVKRLSLAHLWKNNLLLETPDTIINRMFELSKIRACESIYETRGGALHGPGGEAYYAAIWANDQAEYINPYFPFIGYQYGNYAALNSFRHFARFMNDKWNPIPSSIISEGFDVWNGAGDRGDAAMIAYGASRYALALGKKSVADELWALITWCLEYCKRKLNYAGVVSSDTDELENRFESGDANLSTSSLYYDALVSTSFLAKELGKGDSISLMYANEAKELRKNIEKYFGTNIQGYETYAYYKGNKVLRSWICMPLVVGINERSKATVDALFSDLLWTKDGVLTQYGSHTFWDRSTLYALRGAYIAGEAEKATDYLHSYSAVRLLGEHVPYAIESWPEGGQRHLSSESALYGRVITEGIFGIRPIGLNSFFLKPSIPSKWNYARLKNVNAFGSNFDIEIQRISEDKLEIKIKKGKLCESFKLKDGDMIKVIL